MLVCVRKLGVKLHVVNERVHRLVVCGIGAPLAIDRQIVGFWHARARESRPGASASLLAV